MHTKSREQVEVQAATPASESDGSLTNLRVGNADVNYLVYRSSEFPLHDFFFHLKRGDYKKAFRKMKLNYRPSNHEDGALSELLEAGFVPAYVRIKNTGTAPLSFDEKSFALNFSDSSTKAFYSDQLPREFKRFNPKAVAANTYNTALLVVGFAAILGAMILLPPGARLDPGAGSASSDSGSMYNEINTTVTVDYKKLLLSKTTLAAGEEAKGLVFFYTGTSTLPSDTDMTFTPGLSAGSGERATTGQAR